MRPPGISISRRSLACAYDISHQLVRTTGLLQILIARIVVSKATFRIVIKVKAFADLLLKDKAEKPDHHPPKATQEIVIPGQILRCGKQVRLVLGQDTDNVASPNERLIHKIVRARRWFNALSSGEVTTIAALQPASDQQEGYLSHIIYLRFFSSGRSADENQDNRGWPAQ